MRINVKEFDENYDFAIMGTSYAGDPKPNTVMYVTKKVEHLVQNLAHVTQCLVFVENGMEVSKELMSENCFVFSEKPQYEYARVAERIAKLRFERDKTRKYICKDGYYLGENVQLGEGSYIEPGCLIGHDVVIGRHAYIMAGTVIKHAVVGDYFTANEMAAVGTQGFTMTVNEYGNRIRIPSLGKVIIENHVEIGAQTNVACGSSGNTIIEDHVKIDALVHVGHDAHLHKNAEITAGTIIGGFADVNENVYMGINSSIRNRIGIGENAVIGMGAVITKPVMRDVTVVGNPARLFDKK